MPDEDLTNPAAVASVNAAVLIQEDHINSRKAAAAAAAARSLLELHEEITGNGWPGDARYPHDRIDALAGALHDVLGLPMRANRHNRAYSMHLAREALDPGVCTDTIYSIEVLNTTWTSSYVGHWATNTGVTGPTSDDEKEIHERAAQLETEGWTVRVVAIASTRTPVWTGRNPWE